MNNRQAGSFHAILLVGIGVALVAAIGYLFYQNIVLRDKVDDAVQSKVTQETSKAAVVKKEYCAEKEKICFSYPYDWSIEEVNKTSAGVADNFKVTSPDGQLVLQFVSGLGGMGGCCGPMAEGPVTVVSASKVNDLVIAKSDYQTNRADAAYVSAVVTSDVTAEFADSSDPSSTRKDTINGYVPQILLNNAKRLSIPQTFKEVQGGLLLDNLMAGKNAAMDSSDPINAGSFLFGTVTLDLDTSQKMYKTADEAKSQLTNSNFAAAKDILLSVRYK